MLDQLKRKTQDTQRDREREDYQARKESRRKLIDRYHKGTRRIPSPQ